MRIFLIVDDSPVVRKVGNRILSDLGFSVVEAKDGVTALEYARRELPEVIMVDWKLGSMTGLEFLEEFAKIPLAHETKILYCTSEISIPDMTKAKRLGADGFVLKPFDREVLQYKMIESGLVEMPEEAA